VTTAPSTAGPAGAPAPGRAPAYPEGHPAMSHLATHECDTGRPARTVSRHDHAATPERRRLFPADVGACCDPPVTGDTISRYHSLARTSRARAARITAGTPEPGDVEGRQPRPRDIPAPDGYGVPEGRRRSGPLSPFWYDDGPVKEWLAARHGPGKPPAAGGPPKRRKPAYAKYGPKPATTR
jgi:hypothetical protein